MRQNWYFNRLYRPIRLTTTHLGHGEAEPVALVVVVEPGGEPGPEEVDGVVLVAELLPDGVWELVAALVQAEDDLGGVGAGHDAEDLGDFPAGNLADVTRVGDDDDEEVVHGAADGEGLGVVVEAVKISSLSNFITNSITRLGVHINSCLVMSAQPYSKISRGDGIRQEMTFIQLNHWAFLLVNTYF